MSQDHSSSPSQPDPENGGSKMTEASILLSHYTLSPSQLETVADDFYGKVLEVAGGGVASGDGSGFGSSPEDPVVLRFEKAAYRKAFEEALTCFRKPEQRLS